MPVPVKRVYEPPRAEDGYRLLVDRLWPRGLSRAALKLDAWMRGIAPSRELHHWFAHDESRWEEFQRRSFEELDRWPEWIAELLERARHGTLALLFAARDEEHNNALALKKYLERRLGEPR